MNVFRILTPDFLFALAVSMSFVANTLHAAEPKYPSRPVQLIIGYAPGAQDTIIRPFQEKLPEQLKQPVIFVYKPGAGGAVGASFVAKSKPDGHTLFVSSSGPVILNPLAKENLEYGFDDFVPIARVAGFPLVLAVKSDSPLKNIKEVVAAARKSPGELNFSTSGAFSTPHLLVEMFMKTAQIRMTHIPHNGTAPAVTALLGGHVKMAGSPLYGVEPHYRAGNFRILAIGTGERSRDVPDIPTFAEQGFPVLFSAWHGIFGPKGISPDITSAFYQALKATVTDNKDYIDSWLKKQSVSLDLLGPEEFSKEVRFEYDALKRVLPDIAKTNQ